MGNPDVPRAPLLLSVHGIRTTGRWQKRLTEVAEEAGVRYRPLDFGYFMALSLLWPSSRRRKIEWFRDECEECFKSLGPQQRASIVAHSFGTYLLAGALSKYSDLRFDRVIFCGSIVRTDFPWSSIIGDRKQVTEVLNEVGGKDFWAALVSWVVSDAGPSGVRGFDDLASGRVVQRIHPEHTHSDYFYSSNYRDVWLPFLRGEQVENVIAMAPPKTNWRFVASLSIALALLVAGGAYVRGAFDAKVDQGAPVDNAIIEAPAVEAPAAASPNDGLGGAVGLACAALDEDGDKVDNCLDMCAESPAGVPVGRDGCETIEFAAINFDYDKTTLRPDAIAVLDESIATLRRHPNLRVEIAGHTSSRNNPILSMGQSERRARSVYDYLVSQGIDAGRLLGPNGYGFTRRLVPDTNEDGSVNPEGIARNERVELMVQN